MSICNLSIPILGLFLILSTSLSAQGIDSIPLADEHSRVTVADEIKDPGGRAAFKALFKKDKPDVMLSKARSFLRHYPQSAFLAQAYELAARASFDIGNNEGGLVFAPQSFGLLPH